MLQVSQLCQAIHLRNVVPETPQRMPSASAPLRRSLADFDFDFDFVNITFDLCKCQHSYNSFDARHISSHGIHRQKHKAYHYHNAQSWMQAYRIQNTSGSVTVKKCLKIVYFSNKISQGCHFLDHPVYTAMTIVE